MEYRRFNRLITVLYLAVMTIWSGMRYYRSGHLVYHAGADEKPIGCMGTVQKINCIVHSSIRSRHGDGIRS